MVRGKLKRALPTVGFAVLGGLSIAGTVSGVYCLANLPEGGYVSHPQSAFFCFGIVGLMITILHFLSGLD